MAIGEKLKAAAGRNAKDEVRSVKSEMGMESGSGSRVSVTSTDEHGLTQRLTEVVGTNTDETVREIGKGPAGVCGQIVGIEIEAVVGGALQRIRFGAGTNPGEVKAMLVSIDPGVKVREDFPSKGMGGQRATKQARALVINVRVTDSGKFIDLICQNGEDLSVSVSRKSSDTFLEQLKGLNRLNEVHLGKIESAFSQKGTATVVIKDGEQFGVNYWTSDDGKNYLDSMTAEAPGKGLGSGV
jgi:hypothetical protein